MVSEKYQRLLKYARRGMRSSSELMASNELIGFHTDEETRDRAAGYYGLYDALATLPKEKDPEYRAELKQQFKEALERLKERNKLERPMLKDPRYGQSVKDSIIREQQFLDELQSIEKEL